MVTGVTAVAFERATRPLPIPRDLCLIYRELGEILSYGIFSRHEAREAYDRVYGGGRPHHEVSHELLAGAVG